MSSDRPQQSITPDTSLKLTLTQAIGIAGVLLAAGFAVGALYPRIELIEKTQERTVKALEHIAKAVDRIDERTARRAHRPEN